MQSKTLLVMASALLLGGLDQAQDSDRLRAGEPAQALRRLDLSSATLELSERPELGDESGRSVMRSAHGLGLHDGQLWGAGPDYRVRFAPEGAHFTPALGSGAERTAALRLSTLHADRGGERLFVAQPVAPQGEGRRAQYARGLGVEERWEVGREGVELSYVFPTQPAGEGDLVVSLALDGEFVARATGAVSDGLELWLEDFGGVRIGAVTGVDASGARVAGSMHYADGRLELSLPHAFVEQASYPLVLDPIVSGVINPTFSSIYDDADPDVAYDDTNEVYLVCWERHFAATDVDVRGARVSADGSLPGGLLTFEFGQTAVTLNPAVANCTTTNSFLVVYQSAPSILGPFDIVARRANASSDSLSNEILVAGGVANQIDPDVGGEILIDDDVIVVFEQEDGGIRGAEVSVPAASNPFVVKSFTLTTDERDSHPAIATSGGLLGQYAVAWQRLFQDATMDHDIHGAVIDRNGFVLTGPAAIFSSGGPDEEDYAIDGTGSDWLLVYESEVTLGSGNNDIHALHLTYASGGPLLTSGPPMVIEGNLADDEIDPAVAWTGERYLVAWADQSTGLDYDVRMVGLDVDGFYACEQSTLVYGGASELCTRPVLAAQKSGSISAGDGALLVWETAEASFPLEFESEVDAIFLEGGGTNAGIITDLGGGCGGPQAQVLCDAGVGSTQLRHLLTGAQPFTSSFLVIASEEWNFACGSCLFVPDPFSGIVVDTGTTLGSGEEFLVTPIPDNAALVGATFLEQWLVLEDDPACPALGADLSNALRVTIE